MEGGGGGGGGKDSDDDGKPPGLESWRVSAIMAELPTRAQHNTAQH